MLERALPNKHLTEVALNHNYSGLNWIIVLEYICCQLQRSLQITSSGGSAYILRSPWAVVWREWPGWGQKLHLSRRGRLSNRLHRHLCRQSRQLPDPASWLRECVPVEWSDLQWPLLSGAERRTSTARSCCSIFVSLSDHFTQPHPPLPQVYIQTQGAPSLILSISRDEYPYAPLVLRGINSQGAPSQQYQPILMMSKSYTLHWSGPAPREVVLSLINFDKWVTRVRSMCVMDAWISVVSGYILSQRRTWSNKIF